MKTTRKAAQKGQSKVSTGMVDFSYGNTQYQIDTNRRKVYHKWVEVETSRTFLIMGAFSNARLQAQAK
ncbi:MAG TPA: hypothetical protein VFG08_10430 [Candidatus Polarisedimenticolia bacterium]|nr:hypothetical protein [Candidatus Polarisedimenticolia bacterium]